MRAGSGEESFATQSRKALTIMPIAMKTLYIVRHAKSSWKDQKLDDFERPLNKRGRKNAPFMGATLKKRGVMPDFIMASPANRAAMTARIIAFQIDYPLEEIFYDESLYGIGARDAIDLIKVINDDVSRLMLVGHNPGLTSLANRLGDDPVSNIPTCGVYAVRLDISSWEKMNDRCGKTEFFEYPKKYTS